MPKAIPQNKLKKRFSTLVKDLDEKKGIVVAYANVYSNEDFDGDISEPGSFIKTVDENWRKLRVFKNHWPDVELGVPLEKPDAKDTFGLLTKSLFNLEKEVSRDMFSDIQLKMQYEKDVDLSIGYEIIKRDDKDRRRIKEYSLWEYSFLTHWGANSLSTVVSAKSLDIMTPLEKKDAVIDFLVKAYNLNYSDSRLINIELALKSLTHEPEKPLSNEPTAEEIKSLINSIFNKK